MTDSQRTSKKEVAQGLRRWYEACFIGGDELSRDQAIMLMDAIRLLDGAAPEPSAATVERGIEWYRQHGHGHVTPRDDGARARCGGPSICKVCSLEQIAVHGLAQPPLSVPDIESGVRLLIRRAGESPGGATVEVLESDLRTLWRDQMPSINAPAQPPRTSEWQPIETAPKHYTPILLMQDDAIGEGWHAAYLDTWEFANSQHVMRRQPTHWQPLPKRRHSETKEGGL